MDNGAASAFAETPGGRVFTALITPAATGTVKVDVAAAAAQDAVGNDSTAAAQATSVYTAPDATAPTVVSVERQNPETEATNANSLIWRVTFSEAVENVTADDFTVSGSSAAATAVSAVANVHAWDVTVSGGDLADLADATVTLGLASGHDIEDGSANKLATFTPTGTDERTYKVDNTAPGVTITGVPDASSAAFTATFTFSEPVTGFVVGDVTVDNGAASAFAETPGGRVFTALITPAATGTVKVDVAAAAAQDAVGNDSTAAAQATSVYTAPDATAPTVVSVERQNPETEATNANSLIWRVTFSEAVENVTADDFTVSGSSAAATAVSAVANVHAWDVTVSGGDLADLADATVTLGLASGHDIEDGSANKLATFTPTGTDERTYKVDNTAPGVTSAEVDGTSLAVTFDEPLAAAPDLVNSAFTVKRTPLGGTAQPVTLSGAPAIHGRTMTLTLGAAVMHTDVVTVSYTQPTSGTGNALEDAVGNETASFPDRAVSNRTAGSNDATLSSLSLVYGDDNKVSLSPAFDSATDTYTASVANTVSEVTFTAETTDSDASMTAVTLGGTAIDDTNFADGIEVPSLIVGDNTIVITVTAEDNTTTENYTVTVTRADEDERGVTVSAEKLTVREGQEPPATYTVVLESAPTSDVLINIGGLPGDVTATPNSLTFTTRDWRVPQTVTVEAEVDGIVEEDAVFDITYTVSGGGYDNVTAAPVKVTVLGFEVDQEGTVMLKTSPVGTTLTVPEGISVPTGLRVTILGAQDPNAILTVKIADNAPDTMPQGFRAGDAVVDIKLVDAAAMMTSIPLRGQAIVCFPGRGRVFRYDDKATPPEWIKLEPPANGSPSGLACGVTNSFSPFALGSASIGEVVWSWTVRFGRTVADQVLAAVESRFRAAPKPGVEISVAGQRVVSVGPDPKNNETRAAGAKKNDKARTPDAKKER